MEFYLINIRPKLKHHKWQKLRITLLANMSTVPNFLNFAINAVLRPAFVWKLCYELSSVVTFTFTDFWSKFCLLY